MTPPLSSRELPSIDSLRQVFRYDPESGQIFDLRYPKGRGGRPFTKTYREAVSFGGTSIRANRLAWALYYNEWPPTNLLVDHINGETKDNRISNLYLATHSENTRNSWYRRRDIQDLFPEIADLFHPSSMEPR